MKMICPENGFVHIVFASEDDVYFTEHPIAMSFENYMTYTLKARNIEYVFFIDKFSFELIPGDEKSRERYNNAVKKHFFKKTFSESNTLTESIKQLEHILKKGNAAFVISAATLFSIVNDPDNAERFDRLKDSNNSNLLILTFPLNADELLSFIYPDNGKKGVFSASQFKEMNSRIIDSDARYLFPVEEMLKNRRMMRNIIFFNELLYDDILNMIKYYFLNYVSVGSNEYVLTEWIAAVIYAWYNSTLFRCRCNLNLPDNPLRKMKIIINDGLRNSRVFDKVCNLARILRKEYVNTPNQLSYETSFSEQESIKIFFSNLNIDNPETVHNFYNVSSTGYIDLIRNVLLKSYSCFGMIDKAFDITEFKLYSACLFPFVEAERELKKVIKKIGVLHNAEEPLNQCIEEVRSVFKRVSDEPNFKSVAIKILMFRDGLYAKLFSKAIKNYNSVVIKYSINQVDNIRVIVDMKYCGVVRLALKLIKNIAEKGEQPNRNDLLITKMEAQIDDICRELERHYDDGGLSRFYDSLCRFMNENAIN